MTFGTKQHVRVQDVNVYRPERSRALAVLATLASRLSMTVHIDTICYCVRVKRSAGTEAHAILISLSTLYGLDKSIACLKQWYFYKAQIVLKCFRVHRYALLVWQ